MLDLRAYNIRKVSGVLPTQLGNLAKTTELSIHSNPRLSGTVPSHLEKITEMRKLFAHDNPKISGTILPHLLTMLKLTTLDIGSCSISGTIPGLLGRLVSLKDFRAPSNRLSGPLPEEWALRDTSAGAAWLGALEFWLTQWGWDEERGDGCGLVSSSSPHSPVFAELSPINGPGEMLLEALYLLEMSVRL